jgi:UDP-N-acetylmuramyl pentapeptide phosphotransferase/UDP-N-acetylglucosamine-1-phosphate transferase
LEFLAPLDCPRSPSKLASGIVGSLIGAASFLFAVGFVDDGLHIKPYQKLIGQVIGAALVVNYGLESKSECCTDSPH